MMPIYLEQRFQMLLNLAKESRYTEVARENLAAAKEMIDTLFAIGEIDIDESRAYRQLCAEVQIMVSNEEHRRCSITTKTEFQE